MNSHHNHLSNLYWYRFFLFMEGNVDRPIPRKLVIFLMVFFAVYADFLIILLLLYIADSIGRFQYFSFLKNLLCKVVNPIFYSAKITNLFKQFLRIFLQIFFGHYLLIFLIDSSTRI